MPFYRRGPLSSREPCVEAHVREGDRYDGRDRVDGDQEHLPAPVETDEPRDEHERRLDAQRGQEGEPGGQVERHALLRGVPGHHRQKAARHEQRHHERAADGRLTGGRQGCGHDVPSLGTAEPGGGLQNQRDGRRARTAPSGVHPIGSKGGAALGTTGMESKEGGTMDGEWPRPGEQAALWNGGGGRGWVALQELIDRVFQPIENLLANAVSPGTTNRVLDVGCGTGGTTVAVAR